MTTRHTLVVFALAGLPAAAVAQETITYTLDWVEVYANTSVPVSSPNGVIEPGESARIRISALVTPGIGATATFTPPPAPGVGTIAGLGHMSVDLLQTGALGGTWSNFGRAPGFTSGEFGPYPDPDGSLRQVQAGQFVLPGSFANSSNPVTYIWQGTWNLSTYAPRNASFRAQAFGGVGEHSSILIQYGPDPEHDPRYVGKDVDGIFGNTGPIPIVPAPWSLATLALASALARTRRAR